MCGESNLKCDKIGFRQIETGPVIWIPVDGPN